MTGKAGERRNAEAAEWIARLHADYRTPEDEAAFRRWLEADPENRARFEQVSELWDAVGGVRDRVTRTPLPAPSVSRRGVLTLAGAALVSTAGAGLFTWNSAQATVLATRRGERRSVTLPDRSTLMLDTDTEVAFRMGADQRALTLRRGRIHCGIASDPRPFRLEAGAVRLEALRGNYDVRNEGSAIGIVAEDGGARLSARAGAASIPARLNPGERLRIGPDGAALDRPELLEVRAWQQGRAIFRNDPLADAVAEMNRYSDQQLELEPSAAGLRIGGVFRYGDNAAFARTLCDLLPLTARIEESRIVLSRI